VSNTILDIDKALLDLLVSLYFGVDDRAWYYEERGHYYYQPGGLGTLQRRGLVDIVDRTKQNILSHGIGRVKFGVTDAGEEVIKAIFRANPYRIVKASQSYLMWVPRDVTDTLCVDISRLPELLVSEIPIIRETAGLISEWVAKGVRYADKGIRASTQ